MGDPNWPVEFLEAEARLLESRPGRKAFDKLRDALATALDPATGARIGEARACAALRLELLRVYCAWPKSAAKRRKAVEVADKAFPVGLTYRRDAEVRLAHAVAPAERLRWKRVLEPAIVDKAGGEIVPRLLDWYRVLTGRYCYEEWAAVLRHFDQGRGMGAGEWRRGAAKPYTPGALKRIMARYRRRLRIDPDGNQSIP